MMWGTLSSLLSLATLCASAAQDVLRVPHGTQPTLEQPFNSIAWTPCGELSSHNLECGRFIVPLDYANVATGLSSLSVLRLLAHPHKRKGSLFTNQGGPGVSGTGEFARLRALEMMEQLGGEYDIISWDARGVNDSIPAIRCFDTQEEADQFWGDSLWYKGVETNSSLQSDFDRDNFYSRVAFEDAKMQAYWETCRFRSGDLLSYVGTAANARDVAAMADVIEGAGSEINFWGFSYGSILGQYITALFPERLGRVIIDGVVYGPKWSVYPAVKLFPSLLSDTDVSYRGMVKLCVEAGSDGCALASPNATQSSVLADINQLLLDLYDPYYSKLPFDVPYSGVVRTLIFLATYTPRQNWQILAELLSSIQDLIRSRGTESEPAAIATVLDAHTFLLQHLDIEMYPAKRLWSIDYYNPHFAIVCADASDSFGTTTVDLFDTILETRKQTEMFGSMWPTECAWLCHRWGVRAIERVTNYTVVNPKHPVLLLSNMYDPITPIENSFSVMQNSFAEEGDVGLGIRAGYGHCSYSMKSSCIVDVIQAYTRNWTLPPKEMHPCETEDNLFPSD